MFQLFIVRLSALFGLNSSGLLCKSEVHRLGGTNVLSTSITQCDCVDAGEEVFARTEQDRADSDVHLVNKSGLEVLPDRGGPAAEPNILASGRVGRPLQCGMDSVRNEVENCATIHGD